jgi:methylmalonyl-CoA mutase C-terminal domain/subunit
MDPMKRRIKVLLAKLGLDVHNRGVITVAKQLRNKGMEVVYIGNALPDEIIRSALQEDVDVVGVSSLGGAHLSLGMPLLNGAEREGIKDRVVFLMGGVFPPADGEHMREGGFDGVFTPGATGEQIVTTIHRLTEQKGIG